MVFVKGRIGAAKRSRGGEMRLFNIARRMSGRGKFYAALAALAGAAAVLFYLEHLAILYISGAVVVFVLLILAAFSDLDEASIHASEEAYMTWKSEGAFEESAAILN